MKKKYRKKFKWANLIILLQQKLIISECDLKKIRNFNKILDEISRSVIGAQREKKGQWTKKWQIFVSRVLSTIRQSRKWREEKINKLSERDGKREKKNKKKKKTWVHINHTPHNNIIYRSVRLFTQFMYKSFPHSSESH